MANANLRLLLSGEDKLTPTLKNVQNELNGIQDKSKKLNSIQQDFDRITNSSKSMKVQLRQIQTLMAQMNYDGLDASPLFTRMAEHAGQLSDAIGDARTAVSAFANDNFKLEAMAQGMTLVASAGSIATGAMGLFGTENEKVTQAILKVQSALSILNGVQAIANVLNKDSALMLRLKQIRMTASTKATVADSVATSANSASMGANTIATTLAQKAKEKLNFTVAIGKALLGDWTGLLLVGAAALTTYAIMTDNTTDSLDKENKKLQETQDSYSTYQAEVGKATANVTSKMTVLQTQWGLLRTEAEKIQWIKENKSAFDELGVAINSVYDAENLFINHTTEVVNAMIARAKAQAAANKLTNDEIERDERKRDVKKKYSTYIDDNMPVKKGETIRVKTANRLGINSDNSYAFHTVSSADIAKLNRELGAKGEYLMQQELDAIDSEYDHLKKQNTDLVQETAKAVIEAEDEVSKYFKKSGGNGGGGGKSTATKPKTDLELYREFEQKAKNIESRLKVGLIDSDTAREELDKINEEVKAKFGDNVKKIEIDFGVKSDLQIYSDFEKLAKDIQQRYNLNLISEEDAQSQIDALNKKLKEQLGDGVKEIKLEFKPQMEENSLTKIEEEISLLQSKIANMDISLNPEKFNEYMKELIELMDKRDELNKKISTDSVASITIPENNRFAKGSLEDKRQSYDNTMSMINNVGDYLSKGLIDKDEARRQIDELIAQLQSEFPDIELKVKINDDGTIETLKKNTNSLGSAMSGVGSAVNSMGQAMSNLAGENEDLAKAALITSAIGQLVLSFATSMKGSVTVWDWIAGAVAGVATLTSVIAQMQSFNEGGIVSGTSFSGDRTLIRANAGEMVLNQRQQKNLFNALNSGNINNSNSGGGRVEFVIDGRQLKGVLNNYNSKLNRQS